MVANSSGVIEPRSMYSLAFCAMTTCASPFINWSRPLSRSRTLDRYPQRPEEPNTMPKTPMTTSHQLETTPIRYTQLSCASMYFRAVENAMLCTSAGESSTKLLVVMKGVNDGYSL